MKTWAQICKHCTVHQLSENKNINYVKLKKNVSIRAGRYINQAGCKGVRAGRKTVRAGCGALRNMPGWNTVHCKIKLGLRICKTLMIELRKHWTMLSIETRWAQIDAIK